MKKKTKAKKTPKVIKPKTFTGQQLMTHLFDFISIDDMIHSISACLNMDAMECQWRIDDCTHYMSVKSDDRFRPLTKKAMSKFKEERQYWVGREKRIHQLKQLFKKMDKVSDKMRLSATKHKP